MNVPDITVPDYTDVKHNPSIYTSIKVWCDISKYLGTNVKKPLLSLISQNPDSPAGISFSVFICLFILF